MSYIRVLDQIEIILSVHRDYLINDVLPNIHIDTDDELKAKNITPEKSYDERVKDFNDKFIISTSLYSVISHILSNNSLLFF